MSEEKNEAEIIAPEREETIAGVRVVMREYSWVEGMRLERLARPIIDALELEAVQEGGPTLEGLSAAMGEHSEAMTTLIATACDQSPEWVRGLSDADGYNLYLMFWAVNSGFFVRRLQLRVAMQLQAAEAAAAAGEPSGQPDPASETSSPS